VSEARAGLQALFSQAGLTPVAPAILQPLGPFLELSGEDVRRRMYLTSDPSGREFCLRPDFTIAVALGHLARGGGEGRYAYLGPVFRHRPEEDAPGEILQAGAELFGGGDEATGDGEALSLALSAARLFTDRARLRVGDVGLMSDLLDALGLAPLWRRRLWRQLGRSKSLAGLLAQDTGSTARAASLPGLAAVLGQVETEQATRLVEEVLSLAGVEVVGERGAHEIAERFVEAAALSDAARLPRAARELIIAVEAVEAPYEKAIERIAALAQGAGVALDAALTRARLRGERIRAAGIPLDQVEFLGGFVRPLDYYTGLVFEIVGESGAKLVGGGRYDALLTYLGASAPVPAVGLSMWIERLEAEARG
jgi:ATP phosphoribosyltransferase regulatory subunit